AENPVEKVAYGIYHQESWIGAVLGESAARRDWLRQKEDLETMERCGARLITPARKEWPDFNRAFRFFGNAEAPATFHGEAISPLCLWVRGKPLKETAAQSVAVVGTRAVSPYGTKLLLSLSLSLEPELFRPMARRRLERLLRILPNTNGQLSLVVHWVLTPSRIQLLSRCRHRPSLWQPAELITITQRGTHRFSTVSRRPAR